MELQTEDRRRNGDRQQKNPIENNRRPTDRCFIFVLLPILLIWLAISIYVFFVDRKYNTNDQNQLNVQKDYVNGPVYGFRWKFPVLIITSLAALFICLFLYEKLSKFFIYLFSVIYILGLISYWSNLIFLKRPKTKEYTIAEYISTNMLVISSWLYVLPFLIYMITSSVSFFKADKAIICDILKSSCRLIQRSPLLLLFNALLFIPLFMVLSLILNAYYIMAYDGNRINLFFNGLFSTIVIIGGIMVFQMISNFALMVISEYAINYVWSKGEKASIGQIAKKILRNHIGTIMFASTMFISTIFSIIQAFKHKPSWIIKGNYFTYFVTKVSLALTMPEIALIFSSIYGTNFLKSYQKTFDNVLRNCTIHLAAILVTHIAILVLFIFTFIPFFCLEFFIQSSNDGHHDNISAGSNLYGIVFVFSSSAILISSTMKALLINKIIVLNQEDKDIEEKTQIFSHL